jgi:hypothetical protein
MVLDENGIHIGAPLEEFRGIMSGVPTFDRIVKEIQETP